MNTKLLSVVKPPTDIITNNKAERKLTRKSLASAKELPRESRIPLETGKQETNSAISSRQERPEKQKPVSKRGDLQEYWLIRQDRSLGNERKVHQTISKKLPKTSETLNS